MVGSWGRMADVEANPGTAGRATIAPPADRPRASKRAQLLLAVALAVLLGLGLWWWRDTRRFVRTDDAYAQADIVPVTALVAGRVGAVLIAENAHVAHGDLLVTLDPKDAEIALDRGRADVAAQWASAQASNATVAAQRAGLAERDAALKAADAEHLRASAAVRRLQSLAAQGWVTRPALDTAISEARKAEAGVLQARAALVTTRRQVSAGEAGSLEALAKAKAAARSIAALDRTLSLTRINAPLSGTVAALTARVGQQLDAGAPLLFLVPDRGTYIVANFKETQIARIRPGQSVSIWADAIGDRSFRGVVVGLSPATGSQFSLIPVDPASGTFTRIVQRVPVRIRLADIADAEGLRPGLSLKVAIRVGD